MTAPTAWAELCKSLTPGIIEACAAASVGAGASALTREISRHVPDRAFREVLCRGGWYRLGGVLDARGERLADELEAWANAELEARDGDLAVLQEDFADSGISATHLAGRTHYLVAPTGAGPADFLLLEIEDLQEIRAHALFARETPASTLDELLDARDSSASAMPLGLPSYRFRRLSHVGDILNRMWAQAIEAQPIHRFFADWESCSAGRATAFCNHWVLALREHLDRYRNAIIRAKPVSTLDGTVPRFTARQGTSGLALHETLNAFDRQVGYPMAWFFHMLTTRAVPHWVAVSVAEDAQAGFSYLPERDLAVVRGWLHKAYGF